MGHCIATEQFEFVGLTSACHPRRKICAGSRFLTEYPLERKAEGLRRGRRRLTIAEIHVRQRRIERPMAEVLADQEGVRTGANHEHCSGVFEHVRML
jgi:hypothetical protein